MPLAGSLKSKRIDTVPSNSPSESEDAGRFGGIIRLDYGWVYVFESASPFPHTSAKHG